MSIIRDKPLGESGPIMYRGCGWGMVKFYVSCISTESESVGNLDCE